MADHALMSLSLWPDKSYPAKVANKSLMSASVETYPETREAVTRLCARFPGANWRALDRDMAYPAEAA